MRDLRLFFLIVACIVFFFASACGRVATPVAPIQTLSNTSLTGDVRITEEIQTPSANINFKDQLEDFDPGQFDDSTNIDNPWFPLKPGMRYVYEGVTEEGGQILDHRLIINVSDLTKMIADVRTIVVWDQDFSDGELAETELSFFAQDIDGNVWRLGEYPEVYEDGELVEVPAWITGFKGARAGMIMQADPQLGNASYSQGWGPAVGFTDRGQVHQVGQQTCVPIDCYEGVLVVAEFSEEEQDAFQLKYYAIGVGNVRVGWKGRDATKETLELVEVKQLSKEELAQVRVHAFELEERASQNSKEVYANTTPAEITGDSAESAVKMPESSQSDIVVNASDLSQDSVYEFEFLENSSSPGGKFLVTPNTGEELDPPPENDPHVVFSIPVQTGIQYRCWIHMNVGTASGTSEANVLWVQLSDAFNSTNQEVYRPGTGSFLTAKGPTQEGWVWVGCNPGSMETSDPLIYFQTSRDITVRMQAGMEGVGFDQFLLSPARFLEDPPDDIVIAN